MKGQVETLNIIKCCSCESSISTSIHILDEIKQLESLLLSKGNFLIEKEMQISFCQFDKYCTYQRICCKICRYPIGRKYKAISKNLQMLFDGYLLYKNSIILEEKTVTSRQKCNLLAKNEPVLPLQKKKTMEIELRDDNPLINPRNYELNGRFILLYLSDLVL